MKMSAPSVSVFLLAFATVFVSRPLFVWAAPVATKAVSPVTPASSLVTGQVLGPDGKAVANAQVAVFSFMGTPANEPQSVVTDAQGKFTVRVGEPLARFKAALGDTVGRVVILAPPLAMTGGSLKKAGNVFHLQTGRSIGGTVVDEAGKPVAGARVRLSTIIQGEDFALSLSFEGTGALQEKLVVKSGADGRWTMAGLPTAGRAVVSLAEAAYSRAYGQLELDGSPDQTVPMVAKVGARVTGRVVFPGNKAGAGLEVTAGREGEGSQSYGSGVTDKDGRYLISGLGEGNFKITAKEKTGEWVGAGVTGVKTQIGKTTQVADLVLGHGFFIEGSVLDADTGLPVRDAQMGAQGPHGFTVSTPSDDKGKYRVRVVPGAIRLYLYGIPPGYLRDDNLDFNLTATAGQKPLGPIRLRKGLTLTGTALDENGNPAVGAKLMVGNLWDGAQAIVDEAGKWTMVGVPTGNWHHGETPGQVNFSVVGDWQIIQPQSVKPPVKDPLRFVLRHISLASLQGRVVSTDGTPIEGAALQIEIATGNSWSYQRRTSDAQGHFSATKLRPENEVTLTAQKAGFKFVKGGGVTKKDGAFLAEDVVLAPQSATFTGRVLDAAGVPVSGAKVVAKDTDPVEIVTTDAMGKFSITSLTTGPVQVMAAHGYDVGEVAGNTDGTDAKAATNNITLAVKTALPADDIKFVVTLLETLSHSQNKEERGYVPSLAKLLATRDPDTALRLSAASDGSVDDDNLAEIITRLAHHDPARAAEWAPAQLQKIKGVPLRLQTSLELGIAIAKTDPKGAEEILRGARDSVKPTDFSEEAAGTYSNMAALASRLGRPEAHSLVDLAVQSIESSYGPQKPPEMMAAYAESVADGGAELVRYMVSDLSPKDKILSLERAIPRVAPRDVVGAQALLKDMEVAMDAVSRDPGTPQEQKDDGMYHPTPDQSYAVATYSVVEALGDRDSATDAALALSLARKTKDTPYISYSKANMLLLAARAQKPAVALQVLREAMDALTDTENRFEDVSARIAGMAYELDTSVGEEFFARVKKQLDKPDNPAEDEVRPSFASYAFYRAASDPAESRLLLEAEWTRRSRLPADSSYGGDRRRGLAQAMVAVDVARAIEMTAPLSNKYGERSNLYAQIINFVLAPQAKRRTMAFQEYGGLDDDD